MKKILKTLLTAMLITFPFVMFAQNEVSGFNLSKKYKPGAAASYTINTDADVKYSNNVPVRAFRNFISHYKNVNNLHWYNIESGFIAQFNADSIQTRVEFDAKGFWCETISNYTGEQTPAFIRNMVKEVYTDFNIIIVNKVETNAALIYVVKIENKTQFKTLTICNGEMKLTGDYVKGLPIY